MLQRSDSIRKAWVLIKGDTLELYAFSDAGDIGFLLIGVLLLQVSRVKVLSDEHGSATSFPLQVNVHACGDTVECLSTSF